jgi:hypothetical protein
LAKFSELLRLSGATNLPILRQALRHPDVVAIGRAWALVQLWAFWVALIDGATLGAVVHRLIGGTACR